jgi:hypothetical protein
VAKALDMAGFSAREVADYLGHANPSITQDVYMTKSAGGPDAAAALDAAARQTRTPEIESAGFVRGQTPRSTPKNGKGPKNRASRSEGGTRTRDTTIMSRVL